MTMYENREAMLELYRKLGEAEAQSSSQKGRLSHEAMMKELELAAFTKVANVEVDYLKQLIEEHFGTDAK